MIWKFCAEHGCTTLVPNGTERCDTHAAAKKARRNDDRKERGLFSRDWRERRVRVLERDHHLCRLGLPGCTGVATQAHLKPELRGDHNIATDDDCMAACQSCNVYERNHRDGDRPVPTGTTPSKELVFG